MMKAPLKPTLAQAMNAYGLNSKERFPSIDPDTQDKRTGTTFYADFLVAELDGQKGLDDTWRRVWAEWRNNCAYLVELAVCLNRRCWELYDDGETSSDYEKSGWYAEKFHFVKDRIFSNGNEDEPLPKGCEPFTDADHTFAFNVLD